MGIRVSWIALAAFAAGCASAGTGTAEGPTSVPVYLTAAEVPCRFEVIERVEGQGMAASLEEYERERSRVLGRAGARVGADAVLIPEGRPEPGRGSVGVQVRGTSAGGRISSTMEFSGDAIRFVDATCAGR